MFSADNIPYTIEMLSDEFFHAWKLKSSVIDVFEGEVTLGGSFSFIYIDGDHRYDHVRRDFINSDLNLVVGGFVLFDDSFDGNTFGTPKLMEEMLNHNRYKLVMKNPNYLFEKLS